ncbi:glycine-rich RNA-binding protein 2 mitochondrial [Phtheirospermum japonicum]|uniref:Glycine-rich RNA-binding protein 2 mitochondrial n=1 Tax=Phtheirospermum japonicum TaxID=374723 RepID=A0A830D0X1_9LAMI|nr:glycine-rich RNA-binding protein 2 mitochondrial [Phtheirospermum japonicum]
MACFNKVGNMLRQSIVGQPSLHNAVRCMSTKLFVGGLSYGTDDNSLKEAFSSFGDVTDAKVIIDRNEGKSRGFGFVNFSSDESASSALAAMDGQELNGRNIRVSYAQERAPRSSFNNGGGGFGGGFGNNGGY